MRKLHILTLTWNGLDKLQKLRPGLLQNIEKETKGKRPTLSDAVWYIRDNGSKDGTVEEVSKWPEVKVFDIGHNRDSFSKGVNYLFEQANPDDNDLVMLLNNDITFPFDEALREMIYLQKETKAEVIGCLLMYPGSNKIQHAGVIFSEKYGRMPWHYRAGEEWDGNASDSRYFQAVTGACCLVSAKAFREVQGMNERLLWSFDDIDLCLRIGQRKPNNIAMCGCAVVHHEESASLKKNPVNKIFMKQNVEYFRSQWTGKYDIDHDRYLRDEKYRRINI